jgi:hypothetical protein
VQERHGRAKNDAARGTVLAASQLLLSVVRGSAAALFLWGRAQPRCHKPCLEVTYYYYSENTCKT